MLIFAPAAPVAANGLDCTFTTICSPLTDCQTHPGAPFRFDLTAGTLSFMTPEGPVLGAPLTHIAPPGLGALFAAGPETTILLSVTPAGEAVMTEHRFGPGARIESVSYFGTCEPAS